MTIYDQRYAYLTVDDRMTVLLCVKYYFIRNFDPVATWYQIRKLFFKWLHLVCELDYIDLRLLPK